ncbi:MAG TPA: hypothetical protein VKA10_00905, partial [Prolixibacteraceae bacterium]|nr:hypothetical protein [Prolixibacteraceae bacterium]
VGYEIGRAIENGITVLCLFRPGSGRNLSAMITGCPDLKLQYYTNLEDAKAVIKKFVTDFNLINE